MLQLRNYTEDAVKLYLDKWYKDTDMCQCANCRLDVTALMLNKLHPKYIVTEQGALFAQLADFDPQSKPDFMAAFVQASRTVSANPNSYCERKL